MNNKEIEKLIDETLNSDMPNRNVIYRAKAEMKSNNNAQYKVPWYHRKWIYFTAACLVSVIVLIALLPQILHRNENYINENELYYEKFDNISNIEDILVFPYDITGSWLVKNQSNNLVYAKEKYTIDNYSIELYVVMPEFKEIELQSFEHYSNLKQSQSLNNVEIRYGTVLNKEGYFATFIKDNHLYYVCMNVDDENQMLLYLKDLLY